MSIRQSRALRQISISAFLSLFAVCTSLPAQANPPYDVPETDYTLESIRSHLNDAIRQMGQCGSENLAECDYVFRQLDYVDVALDQILRHLTRRNCLEAPLDDPLYWAKQLSEMSRDLSQRSGMQLNFENTYVKFTDYSNMPVCTEETTSEWQGEIQSKQTIYVLSASFGVERCASFEPPAGRSNWVKIGNATSHAVRSCNGKTLCKYVVDWVKIGDPAFDCQKDYKIVWRCDPAGATYEEVRCPEGTDCDAGSGAKVTLACP